MTIKLIDIRPRTFLQKMFGSAKEFDVIVETQDKKIITVQLYDFQLKKSRDAGRVLSNIFDEVESHCEKQELSEEKAKYWLNKIKKMRGKISV